MFRKIIIIKSWGFRIHDFSNFEKNHIGTTGVVPVCVGSLMASHSRGTIPTTPATPTTRCLCVVQAHDAREGGKNDPAFLAALISAARMRDIFTTSLASCAHYTHKHLVSVLLE
ncbi:hypothetical protein KQX54_000720 [Cotesia glomerata]|uniref:Uncharacterized protein n=1 Tax=Cotesia glomerata TaxID=32391 RepID=A0AAV7ISP0_COTGL|nr:hypothetical protein KQX54_000720 [Cotesia glomerata]